MYKITHDLAPKRLSNIFHETPSSRHYNLRGSSTKLCLPQPKTDYLKKSFSYRGAKLWNSLTDDIRSKESLVAFKTSIRAPGQFLKIIPEPTVRSAVPGVARGEGTNSARLFTPGKRKA